MAPSVVGHLADVVHGPSVGGEPLADVVGVGEFGGAVDGDVVVVVDVDQPAESEMAGQRGRFVGDALLEAPVPGDDVGVVVADLGREVAAQPPLGDPHAHAVGHPLAERTGGHLDARGVVVLGMARGPTAPVTEPPQVVEGQPVAGEVEHGVQEDRGVTVGQDEPVPVGPVRARTGRAA